MSLVEHAKRELDLLENDEDFNQSILKAVAAFAEYGHSGGSASYAIPLLNDLLQFKPLSPLTDDPKEWNEVGTDVWQSCRNPEAFSTDGGATYYLLSEMTPYYESEAHVEDDASDDAGAVAVEPPLQEGDVAVPVNVVEE